MVFDLKQLLGLVLIASILFVIACGDKEEEIQNISLIGGTINGSNVSATNQNVPLVSELILTFSSSLNPTQFESSLIISTTDEIFSNYKIDYQNSGSKAVISLDLAYDTKYEVALSGRIGLNGEMLSDEISFSFRTLGSEGLITQMDPCSGAIDDCLHTIELSGGTLVEYYGTYPLKAENVRWDSLKYAVIAIHGLNRNFDEYFNWLGAALRKTGLEDQTVLITPQFKIQSEAIGNQAFWSNTGWREGQNSLEGFSISSFSVIDSIVGHLNDSKFFPALERILVTGHSSGALFTHTYAAANTMDDPTISPVRLDYAVANSQYFYYPTGERLDEQSGQIITPTDCGGYDIWPLGFRNPPPYLEGFTVNQVNEQFVNRSVIYFLGNGTGSDGALNESDCSATLLGSSRFKRGENMYEYMQIKFADSNHEKSIVQGVGHDGQGMYLSEEFELLLKGLFQ